jgi:4-carboxymuconolactone decarboxylase
MMPPDGTSPVREPFQREEHLMSETRFPPLTPEEMTDEQRAVVEAIQAGPRGAGLRGPFNALLRSPVLCDLVQRVGAYVRFGTSLPAPLNELAICMAGRKWGAQYEFYAHRRLGIDAGLNPAILDAVAVGQRPTDMSDDEIIVYEFVTDLLSTGQVSDARYGAAMGRFGERGIMDMVGAVGYYSLVSMVLNVARVPLPEGETAPLKPL